MIQLMRGGFCADPKKEVNMFINKIGMEHMEIGMNCQDYEFEGERESVVNG